MTYALATDYNLTAGMHILFVYANDITNGLFINMMLASIWVIFLAGSYFLQKTQVGTGDIPQSLAVAGFVLLVVTILLSLISGMVSGITIGIVFAISILSILWFLFSKTGRE